MNQDKKQLLDAVRNHIEDTRHKVSAELDTVRVAANKNVREIAKMRPEVQMVEMQLKGSAERRVEELEQLYQTPYFIKCEVLDDTNDEHRTYFFAKYQMSQESIYSWVSPVAAIRFENPGPVSYKLPNGEQKKLHLTSREQYMIVEGKLMFFAREAEGNARELIYQEHFTQQKSEFALPEIVAQMERAQDQVIRAHHLGPLVISGPAGSGKTTLALHRVAYLTQAPDTASLYPPEKIVVFVQDTGTKEYFSHLLPELGIRNVSITTFSLWAMNILGLEGYEYVMRYGDDDEERDLYEYQKIRILREGKMIPEYHKNPFTVLTKAYGDMALYQRQKKEKKLDRFDITLLLTAYLQKHKKFETVRTFNGIVKGVVKKRTHKTPVEYSLIIVDEFQNYLPEQLSILKSCLHDDAQSIIYVGDTAQQVYLGTIKDWKEIGEVVTPERSVRLDKVYRNTKSILLFIESLGYPITVPEGIKEGPAVLEKITADAQEEVAHIRHAKEQYSKGSVGILAKNERYLVPFKEAFKNDKNIHILTMNESQGVEFDLVCIVGMQDETFTVTQHQDVLPEHLAERTAMQKDLLYVALTRAITELHVLGKKKLKDII